MGTSCLCALTARGFWPRGLLLVHWRQVWVFAHCNGLSNTESGSTEIFSFFSGQLYSFGNFVYKKKGWMRQQPNNWTKPPLTTTTHAKTLPPHGCQAPVNRQASAPQTLQSTVSTHEQQVATKKCIKQKTLHRNFGMCVRSIFTWSQGPWAAYGCSSVAKAPSTPVDTNVMAVSPLILL